MFWVSFSFSVVASLMPIEGMMNLYKYIDSFTYANWGYDEFI